MISELIGLVFFACILGSFAMAFSCGGGGSVDCISPEMQKIINDPRNKKLMGWIMRQSPLPQGKLFVDETGLLSFKAERRRPGGK